MRTCGKGILRHKLEGKQTSQLCSNTLNNNKHYLNLLELWDLKDPLWKAEKNFSNFQYILADIKTGGLPLGSIIMVLNQNEYLNEYPNATL